MTNNDADEYYYYPATKCWRFEQNELEQVFVK